MSMSKNIRLITGEKYPDAYSITHENAMTPKMWDYYAANYAMVISGDHGKITPARLRKGWYFHSATPPSFETEFGDTFKLVGHRLADSKNREYWSFWRGTKTGLPMIRLDTFREINQNRADREYSGVSYLGEIQLQKRFGYYKSWNAIQKIPEGWVRQLLNINKSANTTEFVEYLRLVRGPMIGKTVSEGEFWKIRSLPEIPLVNWLKGMDCQIKEVKRGSVVARVAGVDHKWYRLALWALDCKVG
jgi:hypothetical protein